MTKTADHRIRRLYTMDNLPVLRCIDSETADLIYLDPPFNSGKQWENPIGEGNKRALASFKDTWTLSDTHADEEYELSLVCPKTIPLINSLHEINGGSWKAYLLYMGARLVEMRRILKPTGSIYYHCDPVMAHGVKLLMDAIFGSSQFLNDTIWHYDGPQSPSKKKFATKHDNVLRYAKNTDKVFASSTHMFKLSEVGALELRTQYKKDEDGYFYDLPPGDYTDDSIRQLEAEGRIRRTRTGKVRVKYYLIRKNDKYYRRKKLPSVWNDIPSLGQSSPRKEKTGYPTQKPLALLERIIEASSDKDDLVIDPFCGCATTCLAAERLKRQWIGIDLAEEAADLVRSRLQKDGEGKFEFAAYEVEHLNKLPKRTDLDGLRSDNVILKPRLYKTQKGVCPGCEEKTRIELMHFDHIIATSRGGQNTDDNIQLLCGNCNSVKGDRGMHYLWRKILERRTEEKMREYETKRLKRAKDRQQD